MSARIGPIAVSVPPMVRQEALWDGFFRARYGSVRGAGRVWRSAGVTTRHAVVDPRHTDVSDWGTGERMQRYQDEARPLAAKAAAGALAAAGRSAAEIDLFTVVSCTGYATPGLDLVLARDLGMAPTVQRLVVGHMGCYASLPGLGAVTDAVRARHLTALMLSVELPSLHVQPTTDEMSQVVAHALFSDAAAAVVVDADQPGLELIDLVALTDGAHQDAMTWHITDHGFRMELSPEVPGVLAQRVGPLVDSLLGRNGLNRSAVAGWAIHPGGPRILDVSARALDLDDGQLLASRQVLDGYGNCSSTTILLVLDRLVNQGCLAADDHVVALAFGPGLTLYGALLRLRA